MNKIKYINEKIYMHKNTSESVRLGVILTIVGGFLDAYTYILFHGVFANAQTGNIVLVGIALSKGDFNRAIFTLTPIVACAFGIIISEIIKNNKKGPTQSTWQKNVILLELIALFLVGVGANKIHERIIIILISFVSSLQIQSFRKLVDSLYCTTMCTGNLRVATEATYIAVINKDHGEAKKAIRLITIIIFFVLGAFIGGISSIHYKSKSIWIAVVLLIIALLIFKFDEYRFKK